MRRRHVDVGNDCDGRESMIEGNYGIKKHEQGLGNLEYIPHRPSRAWLEIADAIISDVADGASSQWWQFQSWDDSFTALGQFVPERDQGILLWPVSRTSLDSFPRVFDMSVNCVPLPDDLDPLAPTKLCLPIVWAAATLSNRNDRFECDLQDVRKRIGTQD